LRIVAHQKRKDRIMSEGSLLDPNSPSSQRFSTSIKNIDDIARALGVSKSTVSRAISGKGRISPETRERIRSFIEQQGFQINRIAKGLAEARTYNIAVTMPSDTEVQEIPFFQACLHAIAETLSRSEYDTVVAVTTEHDIASLKRLIRYRKVDGVIHTRPLIADRTIDFLKEQALPFVIIGSVADSSVVQVDSDHKEACKNATLHLLRQGFPRQVLLAGNPHHQVNKDRYEGYRLALTEGGIQEVREFFQVPTDLRRPLSQEDYPLVFWNATSKTVLEELLHHLLPQEPHCIIGMDDVITAKVLHLLHRYKVRIPDDVVVVSFHDSTTMEQHLPPISAVHVEIQKLGSLAATLLIDMLEGRKIDAIHRLKADFVIRDSSRAVQKDSTVAMQPSNIRFSKEAYHE